tara:strand:+ start:182 stop:1951 length:1770 start_codon:yes stop_codon:yes gene_type:complete
MAKGIAKQMELFEPVERGFDEGGLMDEGGTVDPISGNDVPPGSTQEEVRDDIPAQLSEGEFVIPADVVRYIGLENLMRMRQEAKQGLAQMEAMGQMGNSEQATVEDDLPFDMYDLDVEEDQSDLNFNLGGVVPVQGTGVINRPNTGPTTGFKPYVAPTVPGFNVPQLQNVQYTQAPQTTNLPTFQQVMGSNLGKYDELRRYVNDAGQVRQIPFKNGQPIYPIPEGFRFEAMGTTTPTDTSTTPVTVTDQQQDDGGGDGAGSSGVTSGRVGTTLGTNPAIGLPNVLTGGVASQADKDAFGGKVGAINNAGYRSAVIDLAGYQLGSLSPTAALANQMGNMLSTTDIGKALGIEKSGNYNEIGTAMNQARGTALAELGLSNMSQVTTNAQYDAITAAMVAAQTAAKKGDLNYGPVTAKALEAHKEAIQAGRVASMTALGYSPTDINNPVAVARAIASYDRNVSQLQGQIDATKSTGFVMDKRGNPVRDRNKNPVMKELSLAKMKELEQMKSYNFNKSKSLSKSKAAKAAAAKAIKDETNRAKEDVAKTAVEQAMDIDPGYSGPGGYGPSGGGTSEGAGGVEGSVGDGYGGGD